MTRRIQLPAQWDELVAQVCDSAAGRRLVVLLDGGSGAGKTTLANALRAELTSIFGSIQLVSLDAAYPGWQGLAEASSWVWQTILRADDPGYQSWDWHRYAPGGWVSLDPRGPIIVEGCGTLTRHSAPLAASSLWYEAPAKLRRQRALKRADETSGDWWQLWAKQETQHWQRNRPWELATAIITGDAGTPVDD